MTALASGLALVPVALGMGKPGSAIQAPMAIVIFCGLLTSTALNMVVVPAVYYRYRRPESGYCLGWMCCNRESSDRLYARDDGVSTLAGNG